MPDKVNRTFVIAECCSSWRFGDDHLANAFRMIELAKECDASAAKFQWTSDPVLMAQRRHGKREEFDILAYPFGWLEKLKAKCDEVGVEFMVTCFIAKDIPSINPLVKRFKVASAESGDRKFVEAHFQYDRQIIASAAFGSGPVAKNLGETNFIKTLHCVCSYPTPISELNLARLHLRNDFCMDGGPFGGERVFDGLSDHTTSVLSGAVAVGAGATIIEKHIKLLATPGSNPDAPHSLAVDWTHHGEGNFLTYVANIREAELAMGTGESVMQECEKAYEGRRVNA